MKIMIPFSGGVNSSYLLWKALTETDHRITILRLTVQPENNSPAMWEATKEYRELNEENFRRGTQIADFMQDVYREFETITAETTFLDYKGEPLVMSPFPDFTVGNTARPLRPGFDGKNCFRHILARQTDMSRHAAMERVDELWKGLDAQNTQTWNKEELFGIHRRLASNVRMRCPNYFWDNPADEMRTEPDSFGPGHWEQYALLPKSLQEMTWSRLGQLDFYHEHIENSGIPVATWDMWAMFLGGYGLFHDGADPKTYRRNDHLKACLNIDNYAKFLGLADEHPARKGMRPIKNAEERLANALG